MFNEHFEQKLTARWIKKKQITPLEYVNEDISLPWSTRNLKLNVTLNLTRQYPQINDKCVFVENSIFSLKLGKNGFQSYCKSCRKIMGRRNLLLLFPENLQRGIIYTQYEINLLFSSLNLNDD